MVLVIAEKREGVLHKASWEQIVAAQQTHHSVQVAVAGVSLASVAAELAAAKIEAVLTIEHPALESYTPDGFVAAFADVVTGTQPDLVFLPHTYQTREFAPKLATRLGRSLITDCIAVRQREPGTRDVSWPQVTGFGEFWPVIMFQRHTDWSSSATSAVKTAHPAAPSPPSDRRYRTPR